MLSKIFYKTLMVFALAFFAQVGYSQSYVSSDAAQTILKAEIAQFESNLNSESANTAGNTTLIRATSKVQINMMKYVLNGLYEGRTVSDIMTTSFTRANNVAIEKRKAAKLDALNAISELLS